ncbi:glutathione synthase/RimK-type ligase-like ATP-grasp enzyme [Lysinibacillus composti]|uniref:YheC/YheD family protein n=1 Tax=Lysinibacillus composti TaxID=720633 RepID=A0A3N9UEZ8_9BACI|nr:YheC/YheD family protein [Lysinibacillus composti]MBM7608433.1 glutathione synthase/RimK-type ligase-like ATP-grasp enzyme [Lysinibacillus composti]RQW74731.1 YheC/YheD family protein [Lysinibacillus composti]
MITIGMLHYRKNPQTVFKSYAYAAAAKMEGVHFFYFTPGNVDLENKRIKGLFYENGAWVERETGYPDVVFNAGGTLTAKQDLIVDALEKEIPFTSHPIGDKMKVYQRIKKGKRFTNYLIPSEDFERIQTAFSYLDTFNVIIIKPLSGAKGEGIYFIEKRQDDFLLIVSGVETVLSEEQLEDYLVNILLDDADYLVQPFIQSKTKQGQSFDIRLYVQKNGEGKWRLTTMYPRIASKGIVANVSSGGYSGIITPFLEEQFDEHFFDVKRHLEVFAVQFATYFDRLYDEQLDELGIDVGIDKHHKIWMYEVNWRPGTPALFFLEMDIPKTTIQYATYLAKKALKEI